MKQFSESEKKEILSLLDKAYTSRINNLPLSIQLAEKALDSSRQAGDKELTGKSLSQLSLFYMIKGEHSLSSAMAEEAIGYFKELGDEKGIADAKYNLAGINYKTDNFHLGLIYLIDCLGIYRKFNDYHNQARVQKSLGTIYEFFGDQNNAVKAYESSIESAQKAGDTGLVANAYNPLSGIYIKQGKITEALNIIEKAIMMKKQAEDIRGLAFSLYGRAKVYTHMGRYEEAKQDLQQALDIHMDVGEKLGTGMAYRKMGLLYMAMGDLNNAKEMFAMAAEIGDKYNIAMVRFKSYYHLYEVYRKENDNTTALKYLEEYINKKEAVINTQTMQVIENYELITKMERMEKEAQLQKEKAEIIEKKNLAEQASKVKQEFLSTMSHEIRTPLNAIITISSLLKEKTDPEEKKLTDTLKFAANNLLLIINDILDFTKLDTSMAQLRTHPCNLKTLLESVKNTYDNLAREKELSLTLTIDPKIAEYYEIDEIKLSQILGNLVNNAIKYTEAGNIEIAAGHHGNIGDADNIKFSVTDTGIGIDDQHFEKIFESFSQPHAVTTRKHGGSGLGLAIVKKLVELHQSYIQVKSTVGKGSRFSFELILTKCNVPAKAVTKDLHMLNGKTALLAEDNMVNAMVALKLLSKWGVAAEHAKNGVEALDMAKLKKFDLILMDIHMPEMNGFDATKHIRSSENPNTTTPIFAFTADITAEQQEEYIPYFSGFLRKPINIESLYDTLVARE